MDETAPERMRRRLAEAQAERMDNARLEAALEHSRTQVDALAAASI